MPTRRKAATRLALVALVAVSAVGGCGIWQPPPEVTVPADIPHVRSAAQVEEAIRRWIASNEAQLGRAVAPTRITSIRLVRPGMVQTPESGEAFVEEISWVVEFDGTVLFCGMEPKTCNAYAGGTYILSDNPSSTAYTLMGHGLPVEQVQHADLLPSTAPAP